MSDLTPKDKRGLASASPETRKRVAAAGGKAFHAKRGARGKDTKMDKGVMSA